MSKTTFRIIVASVLLVTFIFMAFLMCSTGSTTADAASNMGFEVLDGGTWDSVWVVYDVETGVMYVMSNGSKNMGTMTVMVNPDGTPRIYEGFDGK